ncbi:Pentatricopeptide repeat [Macleaya cordata]|uniref:Pentatricopeptide repeat n=1 Tax=Macleaya cordata TaxID=56857 RepID=A0A200R3T0_MACCD|nr:Pentatricopeptide repeat [Macleaya cordata]
MAVVVFQSLSIQCCLQTQQQHKTEIHQQRRPLNLQISSSSKSGELSTTHKVFDEIPHSVDTFAWNTLIQTHLGNGAHDHVISIYRTMLLRGVHPDKHTLPRVLTASRLSGSFFCGKQIHGHTLKLGFGSDQYVVTALMEMYGRHDGAAAARRLFDQSSRKNSVSWTLMAGLYIIEDKPNLAIETFHQMLKLGAENVDAVALSTVLSACGRLKSLQEGKKVHEIARKRELEFDVLVSNSLLKMYLDCGSIKDARLVFDRMHSKDVISWTAILSGYVKNGGFNEGLKLFRLMNSEGIKPDSFSVSSVLPACARISARKHGREIHAYTLRNGVDSNIAVQNAQIDMYMKSGCSESASKIFVRMREKDTISWTIMILGYSLHGQGRLGVELFQKMMNMRVRIDDTVYVAVLCACNTARMVEEGKSYFKFIRAPKIEHYSLMVSLLGRAGHFDEARSFIDEHQIEWHKEVQRALLAGCRIHRNTKMAKRVIERLTELEPLNAENYLLLSNMYAANAKWDVVKNLRELIRDMDLRPKKAYTWIEIRNKVHVFGVGDVSHPRSERIYYELQSLMKKMKEGEGYIPDRDFGFHDVDEERECIPIGHSEMLAISFGLISTQVGTTLRITKNLRVCHNCHSSAKMISKIVGREIILKDPDRFHHFKDGICSCEDFW